jgi:phosphonate transport system permease protein
VAGTGALLVTLVLTAGTVELNFGKLVHSSVQLFVFAGNFFVMPDWAYIPDLFARMAETVGMALLATTLALFASVPLAILGARNTSPNNLVFRVTRDFLSVVRALPELVWALVFVSAVGLGPLAGVMALSVVTVGFMAKLFAESIEVVDRKAVEGVQAVGAGWFQLRTFAMLPQALPDLIGTTMYIIDHNLRAAAILGIVGAGGIGFDMIESMHLFRFDRLILITASIYVLVSLLDHLSPLLRKKVI